MPFNLLPNQLCGPVDCLIFLAAANDRFTNTAVSWAWFYWLNFS